MDNYQSKGITRKGIRKASRSVRTYVYLVLASQVQARSSTMANSESLVDAQQIFKRAVNALINEDYSVCIDFDNYQSILEYALSKMGFLVGKSASE